MNGQKFPTASYTVGDRIEISGSLKILKKPQDHARLISKTSSGYCALGIRIPSGSRSIEIYLPAVSWIVKSGDEIEGAVAQSVEFSQVSGTSQTDSTRFKLRYN